MYQPPGGELEQIVRWELDYETGTPRSQSILLTDGATLHCDHFPAYQEFDPMSGRTVLERWYNFGVVDRLAIDQPSEIRWKADGTRKMWEFYTKMGEYHREHHRPAKIWYSNDTGTVVAKSFGSTTSYTAQTNFRLLSNIMS